MMATTTYIVEYGDWLAKVAEEHGTTVSAIWNHPENAEHRAKRGSPDVLYPGDVLRIPVVASAPAVEPAPGQPQPSPAATPPVPDQPWPYPPFAGPWSTQPTWECPGGTCACHPVPEDEPKDEHVIVFYDPQGVRMPGARCRVYEQGRLITPEPSAADGAGEIRVEMRASTSSLQVEWAPAQLPPNEFLPYRKMYQVKLGGQGDTAVEKRLSNLGFSRGKRLEDNVRDYQRAYSREPTGNVEEIRLEVL
ncbi:MAG: LysM peptidoglycan-binding domain-containing protein, partial [Polyangiaceae bacterium]|nr:LysM peptidoglycan-binding domain-containing protein [Polyangiaceae bacterium]